MASAIEVYKRRDGAYGHRLRGGARGSRSGPFRTQEAARADARRVYERAPAPTHPVSHESVRSLAKPKGPTVSEADADRLAAAVVAAFESPEIVAMLREAKAERDAAEAAAAERRVRERVAEVVRERVGPQLGDGTAVGRLLEHYFHVTDTSSWTSQAAQAFATPPKAEVSMPQRSGRSVDMLVAAASKASQDRLAVIDVLFPAPPGAS